RSRAARNAPGARHRAYPSAPVPRMSSRWIGSPPATRGADGGGVGGAPQAGEGLIGGMGVDPRAGLRPLLVNDSMHVNDLGVGRVNLPFQKPAVQVEQRQVLRFQIIERAAGS